MAIEGNLRDMSLPNIMQITCLEQRKVGLTLNRQQEKGSIFFDNGDIIHAAVNSLEGEEAVYYMLTWDEGTFRMTRDVVPPKRTISARWDKLLMEGMKRLDEYARDKSQAPSKKTLSAGDIAFDSRLENDIIMLLSNLEHARTKLADKGTLKRPAAALQILVEMAHQTMKSAESYFIKEMPANSLREVLDRVAIEYPIAGAFQAQGDQLPQSLILTLFNDANGKDRRQVFVGLSRSIISVIDAYLAQLTARFRSAIVMEGLREAYMLFLTDLAQVVEQVYV
ncbi:MAG: DUF4388 domain-containing protein [Acidobacteriota bacterium]|nr:DUF4388 domain-containing protein [Acidobacteriota bacterium]